MCGTSGNNVLYLRCACACCVMRRTDWQILQTQHRDPLERRDKGHQRGFRPASHFMDSTSLSVQRGSPGPNQTECMSSNECVEAGPMWSRLQSLLIQRPSILPSSDRTTIDSSNYLQHLLQTPQFLFVQLPEPHTDLTSMQIREICCLVAKRSAEHSNALVYNEPLMRFQLGIRQKLSCDLARLD